MGRKNNRESAMEMWNRWFICVKELRSSCARRQTYFWMVVFLMALTTRCGDLSGVTSAIRNIGLQPMFYDRLLDFFHSPSVCLSSLTQCWVKLVLKIFPTLLNVNERYVIVGDGIKIPKAGKKMPGVKMLHQQSASNTKPEYIMGHSCQAVSILAGANESVFAIPLISRIHEGTVFSNRHKRTLLDKMVGLLEGLSISKPFYFVADAYYATSTIIKGMLKNNNHLITRVKSNAVAFYPEPLSANKKQRGRPKQYGNKIKLKTLFDDKDAFEKKPSPLYGEKNTVIQFRCKDLLWRSAGVIVRFVAVIHPTRGRIILMTTDLNLLPIEVIRLYGLRFKIEYSFKQSIHTVGTYAYHFWMKMMKPIRRGDGDQYMHKESQAYRENIKRKLKAYHLHIQLGIIAQGLLQYLSCSMPTTVWSKFGSWLRTIRPGIPPSEQVTAMALKNTLPEFLAVCDLTSNFKKFLLKKIDFSRIEGSRLVA